MAEDGSKILFYPFEADALPAPAAGASTLFLGAEPGFRLPEGFAASVHAVQGFRPSFLQLEQEGRTVLPLAEGDGYDMAMVLAGRHRGQNELRVAEALDRVRDGGLILVAGAKDDGIASLRKRLAKLATIDGHVPKHHGVAFWFQRRDDAGRIAATLRSENRETLVDGRFHVAPGMFSVGGVDRGSQLLAAHLPRDIKGAVADFCSGWGYLSRTLADGFHAISTLDLYEADFASIKAAKRNLDGVAVPVRFFWHDLAKEPVDGRYDVVVMNPPFHTARKAEPDLGQTMIEAASRVLKRGGRLLMVANRQLPYEQTLAKAFTHHGLVFADGSFKVLVAFR